MERSAFLDRLRVRLASPAPPTRPIAEVEGTPIVRYVADLTDAPATFTEQARLAGARVDRVTDPSAFVAGVAAECSARRVVVSRDPEVATLALDGLEVAAFEGPDPAADLGVVGAAWGIAATGTVVLDAARAGGRSASLLPPAVCVLLPEDRILPEAGALFRHLEGAFPDGLPSQLVLLTGPSKTGDIEQQLITGVHGPGRVWIGLLASS